MEEMTLRVPVAVKAKVTEELKNKIVTDLEDLKGENCIRS